MQGQSDYTPLKQKHISGILRTCQYGLNPKEWSHDDVLFVDCTAGSGYTEDGQEGSPLIVNGFARTSYVEKFKHLCCEIDKKDFQKLKNHAGKLKNATIEQGDYRDIAPAWLDAQNNKKPALGIIYCDPNGARDLLHGVDMFKSIAADRRFSGMDFLFHFSLHAYKRNHEAGTIWADKDIIAVTDELASFKKYAYLRLPTGRWQWVIMHLLNTDKVKPEWKTEKVIAYEQWKAEQAKHMQRGLFDQPDLMTPLTETMQSI